MRMAHILLQKITNSEISLDELFSWLAQKNVQDPKYQELSRICFQDDFVTYFLNIIHGLIDNEPLLETPVKLHASVPTTRHSKSQRKLFVEQKTPESLNLSESLSLNSPPYHPMNLSGATSTPKMLRFNSYCSMDDGFSPIRRNLNTSRKEFEAPKSTSFCLGDFIVPSKKNGKKKVQRHSMESLKTTPKRINPTKLNESKENNVFVSNENSFNFTNGTDVVSVNENVDRSFLKKEIERISAKPNAVDGNILEQMKKNLDSKTSGGGMEIFPNPKLVRFKEKLDKIVIIYEFLLKNSLVVSVIGEIHFVISLLFNKCYCESVFNNDDLYENLVTFGELFKTIHNVVYFACCVLGKFIFFLKSLDKSTLKFMCGNERLTMFAPALMKNLENIAEAKTERFLDLYESRGKRNVCFVLDTDNRTNFPTELSFQSFKKQRDTFYEILKIWEDGHMAANWSFEQSLGRKIKYLLECHRHPVNLSRFSRLFMDQLLSSYEKNCLDEISEEASSTLLTSLPNIDKNKFDRLNSRLVTKESTNGLNSAPEFPGYQEFYKDFIEISSNPNFLRHLCDVFISEIIELNETTFTDLDVNSTEYETDQDTKKAYVSCLKSLRALAKFLGLVESMPYKSEASKLPDNVLEQQIKIRNQVKPNFDVLEILQKSISNRSVVLCVPWLCSYLSMLDPLFLKSSYYVETIRIMVMLYRNIDQDELPEYNIYLIKYTLGWFFELNNLQNVFFQIYFSEEIPMVVQLSNGIDKLLLVDQNILYIFCPYLEEIKRLLSSKKVTKDRLNVRHITPLTATGSKRVDNNAISLEEAFFNGQPSSVRKTVEFVAERVTSTCVKYLCYEIVPHFKKNYIKELQRELRKWTTEGGEIIESTLRRKAEKLAEENIRKLENLCTSEVDKIVENNVKCAIHALLPLDTLPCVECLCVSASKRMCLEKVKRWISTHIVLHLLSKDITGEISKLSHDSSKKKLVFLLPPGGSGGSHNENTESAAHILDKIRDHQVGIFLSNNHCLEEENLLDFLCNVYRTLTERHDVNEAIHFAISSQLVDFFLLLVAFQPLIVENTMSSFIEIWKLEGEKTKDLFSNLLSRRNLMLLSQSDPKIADSWSILAKVTVELLKAGFLSSECFESQCTGLFQWDLAEETLKNATNFLSTFVQIYKKDFNSSSFTYLLEFLSDYCRDL